MLDYKFSTNYVSSACNRDGVPIKGCFYHSIFIGYEEDDDDCDYTVLK